MIAPQPSPFQMLQSVMVSQTLLVAVEELHRCRTSPASISTLFTRPELENSENAIM